MRIHFALIVTALLAAACNRGVGPGAAAGGGGRGGGPAGVKIVTLENHPLEDASEFISTVRSLHSTTVQPQVEGRITKIYVKAGDGRQTGAALAPDRPPQPA